MQLDILIARARKRKSKRKQKPRISITPPLNARIIERAIVDSFGNISVIAQRVGKAYATVQEWLRKAPDYIQEALREERERLLDIAEQTNLEMMTQRIHFPTAIRASHFVLTKHPDAEKRGYKDKSELIVQGGKNPIQFQNEHILSIEKLKSIPLDARKKLLAEMDEDQAGDNGGSEEK